MMKKYTYLITLLCFPMLSIAQGYNGIIAHWRMNGNATDSSSNGLNGTLHNVAPAIGYNGTPNSALQFDGTSSYISVPYNAAMNNVGNSYSICALVKPTGFYNGPCQGNAIVWRSPQYSQDHYGLFMFDNAYDNDCGIFSPDKEVFAIDAWGHSTSPAQVWQTTPIAPNTWYCVVGTFQNDSVKLYVNGALVINFKWSGGAFYSSTNGLNIGMADGGPSSQYPYPFKGVMDDIRIYGRTLSAQEANIYCDSAKLMIASSAVNNIHSKESGITISPNPANEHITINFNGNNSHNNVYLINNLGQVIDSRETNNAESVEFNLSLLPSGLYFVRVQQDENSITQKFIKQ